MGLMTGALSGARFRVVGDLPAGWREIFRDRLNELAFMEPPNQLGKEEVEGWVLTQNLLDTDFTDFNRWLVNDYALLALRVDKKRLPGKLFKAHLDKKIQAWCQERGVERAPNAVKTEIKEKLEEEWLARAFPSVGVTEAIWSVENRYLLIGGFSESVIDRFRKRFFRTFGLKLVPWSPLDWLGATTEVEALIARVPTEMTFSSDNGAARQVGV